MSIFISIAMSTYNGEKFIKEQLDSILNQTHQNLEIIISDDCSTDKTIDIIKDYNDKRISLYQNVKNIGFVKNFEHAISLCSGDFIALSDQDDIWKNNKIETLLKEIQDYTLIYSNALVIDKDSNQLNKEFIKDKSNISKWHSNYPFLLNNVVSGNTMMFKKELTSYILPIPQNITYHDFWITFVASTYGKITAVEEPLTYYRRYSEQVTYSQKVKHKNYVQKLKYKKERLQTQHKNKLHNLEAFKSLQILKDPEVIFLIDSLIWHFKNYDEIYFNFNLYKILKKHSDDIFATVHPSKRYRNVLRYSSGLKLHSLSLFIL